MDFAFEDFLKLGNYLFALGCKLAAASFFLRIKNNI